MKIATLFALTIISAEPRQLIDRVAAVVNDEVITLQELKNASASSVPDGIPETEKKTLRKQVLDALIREKLIEQQVTEAKISVSSVDVDRAIEDITRQNNITREALEKAVTSRGMTWQKYRSDLEQQIVRLKLIDLKVRSRVSITDAEIRAAYDEENRATKRAKLITLRHLFFRWGDSPDPNEKARISALAIKSRQRVLSGEAFEAVAKEVSDGPTATQGGSLGEIESTSLLPELAQVAKTLKIKQLSEPISTQNGIHVIQIQGVKEQAPPEFETRRNTLYQRLYQSEVERQMALWIDELKKNSVVDIRL